METFKGRSCQTEFRGILILTVISTIWISSQITMAHGITATTIPVQVKITSPYKGQQEGIGNNVTLLGTSTYNATNKCQVSIIVDNTRPYQDTIPTGQGTGNYSEWKYNLAPTYAALREGMNRVTAKLTCDANPIFTKFYSINLTGITQPTSTSQQQIATRSNGTASPFFLPTSFSLAPAPSNSTSTPSVLPIALNSSSTIDPSSTQSSSASSGAHSHSHNHSHHSDHSSSSDSSSSSHDHHSSSSDSSSSSHDHHSSSSDSSSSSHDHHSSSHTVGSGHDFFHGAFSHFGGF